MSPSLGHLARCAALTTLVACGSPPLRLGTAGGAPSEPDEPSTTCPVGVRGARIQTAEEDGAVVIALKAYGDVDEVRRRAHDAAAMYGPGAHRGRGHHGVHGVGGHHGLALDRLGVPVTAVAEDTEDGARIVVRSRAASDLPKVRSALSAHERRARTGACS